MGKLQDAKASLMGTIDTIRENEKDPAKMKLKEYIAYALGKLSYGSIAKLASDYLNVYYISAGFSPERAGKLTAATRLFDSLNDPVVSTIIDNGKGKKGRFKPYLAPLVIPLAVLSIFMFIKPPFASLNTLMYWCFFTYAVWETINTFSGVSFGAIATVMSADKQERTLYTTIGNIGNQFAGTVPGLIPFLYPLLTQPDHPEKGIPDYLFYTICAVAFAVIGGSTGMFTRNLQERVTPPKSQEHFWDSFVTFFKNKNLILLWSADLSGVIGSAGAAANQEFYRHSLGRFELQGVQWALAGAPHTIAISLAPLLLKRIRATRLIIFTNLLSAGCHLAAYFIVKPIGYATLPGIILIMFFTVIAWIPQGIGGVAKEILKMNTFDYTEMQTGQRAEATSLMVTGVLSKWVGSIAALVGGYAMKYIGFQSPDADGPFAGVPKPQTLGAKNGLFFIFLMFPAIGALLSAIPTFFFKLEGPEFDRTIAEFRERRAELEKAEEEMAEV